MTTTLSVDDYLKAKYVPVDFSYEETSVPDTSSPVSAMTTRSSEKRFRKPTDFFHSNMTYANFDAFDSPNREKPDLSYLKASDDEPPPIVARFSIKELEETLHRNRNMGISTGKKTNRNDNGMLIDTDKDDEEYKDTTNENNDE